MLESMAEEDAETQPSGALCVLGVEPLVLPNAGMFLLANLIPGWLNLSGEGSRTGSQH